MYFLLGLFHTVLGMTIIGTEAEYISLSREDLRFLIAEVSTANNAAANCSLQLGNKEQLESLALSIGKIADELTVTNRRKAIEECRDCFTVGSQTFIAFPTKTGTWDDAKNFCEEKGLVLPEPRNPNALSKHLRAVIEVEQNYYWVGGRGDGMKINWLSGGSIDGYSKWWWGTNPGNMVTSAHCLVVVVHTNPSGYSTFYSPLCETKSYFICEKV